MQQIVHRLGLIVLVLFGFLHGGLVSAAKLVQTPPSFDVHPRATSVQENTTATFSSHAGGDPQPTYQWQRQDGGGPWQPIAGATSATYTLVVDIVRDNKTSFRAVATNAKASKNSNAARLTVTPAVKPVVIVSQPASQTVAIGKTAQFNVAVTGGVKPLYQWQRNAGGTFVNIAKAISAAYTTKASALSDSGAQFRVIVTSGADSVTSQAATLTVTPPPTLTITTQPLGQAVTAGQSAQFSVGATATVAPTYQWFVKAKKGGYLAISQANQATYSTPAATLTDSGNSYFVRVRSGALVKDSAAAKLTVTAATASAGQWTPTALAIDNRAYHTATRLSDGRVLVVGGWDLEGPSNAVQYTAEIYDPSTDTFHATGNLNDGRMSHRALLLKDGRVLITGGAGTDGTRVTSSEIYDPQTGTFQSLGSDLITPRIDPFLFNMPDGRVLIAGGYETSKTSYINPWGHPQEWNKPLRVSQLFDPAALAVAASGSLVALARDASSSATQLADGRVLLVGGMVTALPDASYPNWQWVRMATAEMYDPATGQFSPVAGSMAFARSFHQATLLADGKVLITGGDLATIADQQPVENYTASAEVFSPDTQSFAAAAPLLQGRSRGHTMTLLPDGKVLVVGGFKEWNSYTLAEKAELYDPATGQFSQDGTQPRSAHQALLLLNGKVLLVGGRTGNTSLGSLLYE